MHLLEVAARWNDPTQLPKQSDVQNYLRTLPNNATTISHRGTIGRPGVKALRASYSRPYQSHGSIGHHARSLCSKGQAHHLEPRAGHVPAGAPRCRSCSTCRRNRSAASTSKAPAVTATMPRRFSRDAALIARALPGKPIRVQLMREQEHGWEPFGRRCRRRSRPRSTANAN